MEGTRHPSWLCLVQAGQGGSCQVEPPAEPRPLCAAQQPQVVQNRAWSLGLCPPMICARVQGQPGEAENSQFLPLSGCVPMFPCPAGAAGIPGQSQSGVGPKAAVPQLEKHTELL